MKKIKGLIKLVRFELPFSAGICTIMGQLLALGIFAPLDIIIYTFFSIFLISASILVSNDYFDIETDKINAPERPIPSNQVLPHEALMLSLFLLLSGLVFSYLISIEALIISSGLAIVGFLYNRIFKKYGLIGNLMVSFSVGMTFVYGGLSVGLPFHKTVLFFGLIAALIDLGEEIAADAIDIEGDLIINSRSIAIKYGKYAALNVSRFIFILVVILTVIPFVLKWFSEIYLVPILIMDVSIIYPMLQLLNESKEKVRKYLRIIYLGSTIGIVVFILMRLFSL